MKDSKLKRFLDRQRVPYRTLLHRMAYSAQETAQFARVSGKQLAKTVMVKIDGELSMVVLPASERVDLDSLKDVSGAKRVELAREEEFVHLFPDCELGAMPPFGSLYGVPEYVDEKYHDETMISFRAGSHTEVVQVAYKSFIDLLNPQAVFARFRCAA